VPVWLWLFLCRRPTLTLVGRHLPPGFEDGFSVPPCPSVAMAGGASGCPRLRTWAISSRATSVSSFPMARPTRRRVSMSITVPRQKVPRSASSGCPLFHPCGPHKSTGRQSGHP
jgi:hypothetical protein